MININYLSELCIKAQKLVDNISNEKLKEKAFGAILTHLISLNQGKYSLLNYIRDFSVIVTCISLIIGIMVAIINIMNSNRHIRFAGLEQAKEIFNNEERVKDSIAVFVNHFDNKLSDALIKKYGSGRAMYYSNELYTL